MASAAITTRESYKAITSDFIALFKLLPRPLTFDSFARVWEAERLTELHFAGIGLFGQYSAVVTRRLTRVAAVFLTLIYDRDAVLFGALLCNFLFFTQPLRGLIRIVVPLDVYEHLVCGAFAAQTLLQQVLGALAEADGLTLQPSINIAELLGIVIDASVAQNVVIAFGPKVERSRQPHSSETDHALQQLLADYDKAKIGVSL